MTSPPDMLSPGPRTDEAMTTNCRGPVCVMRAQIMNSAMAADSTPTGALSLFLTDEELHELTGYVISKYQAGWLKRGDWIFEVNAAGAPRVARAYFERRMVGEATTPDPAPRAQHNFGAIRRVK